MKKILALLLLVTLTLSFSACLGGVKVKTDYLATEEDIEDLLEDKEMPTDDYSIKFNAKYSADEYGSEEKYCGSAKIEGTLSYAYDRDTEMPLLEGVKLKGSYEYVEEYGTIAGVKKMKESGKESIVHIMNHKKGTADLFHDYSKTYSNAGVKSKEKNKVYYEDRFDSYIGSIYPRSLSLLNKYLTLSFIARADYVFLDGNDVYVVNSDDDCHEEVLFRFEGDEVSKIVVEFKSIEGEYTIEIEIVDYIDIEEPSDRSEYEGY